MTGPIIGLIITAVLMLALTAHAKWMAKTYVDAMIHLGYTIFALVVSHIVWVVIAIHGALK